jgi:hypothetical protein
MEFLLLVLDGSALILVVIWTASALARPPGEQPTGLFAWRAPVSTAREASVQVSKNNRHLRSRQQ